MSGAQGAGPLRLPEPGVGTLRGAHHQLSISVPVLALDQEADRIYARLMAHAAGEGNDAVFACIYASWCTGGGAMPDWLGLTPDAFHAMLDFHFPGCAPGRVPNPGRQVPPDRLDESADLRRLMLRDRAGATPSELWMAEIVAAGCMASDHLWHDLGLWSRPDLTALMRRNFPGLAARNLRDMKWKRFLYKQLCEAEGIYTCRSPSCEVCSDYRACFGPEE
jgi:nitrogen fixation protein NifQ